MKKISFLLLCLLALSFNNGFSQKCKVGADPITNEKVASFDFSSRTVFYEYKSGVIHLEMKFTYSGSYKVIVPKETEMIFKLENGEIIKLATISDAPPKTRATATQYSAYINTDYSYLVELTKDQVTKLATSKVILIRYPDTQGGSLDYTPKGLGKIYTNVLFKGANCIRENF
jgi:hypothetical protein